MTDRTLRVKVDPEVSVAYIAVSDLPVRRTVEVSDLIYVDLDEHAMVRGIELLDLDVVIPYDELERRFHVDSTLVEALKTIRPTINSFMAGLQKPRVKRVPTHAPLWVQSDSMQSA